MKLIIQIPCYNEAGQLPLTLPTLPRTVPGFDRVEWLVVDDGSTDGTAGLARSLGVDHVVELPRNRGLARAFLTGIEASLRRGADVVVNFDADNQYRAEGIPDLVAPLLSGEADVVVGCRPIGDIAHFSWIKKALQKIGSGVVRLLSGTHVDDATSGFRAYSRAAAMRLNVYSRYTYTLETLIQAGQSGLRVISRPIAVNPPTRESRLMKSMREYVWRSTVAIVRSFVTYRPMRFFMLPAVVGVAAGGLLGLRFVVLLVIQGSAGNVQSLILAAILILLGALCAVVGLVADLLSVNRRLLEDIQLSGRLRDWREQ
mgnify:CR=1 FL=1